MTKFEQVGINYQFDATSKEEARKSFKFSCDCCCNKGMRIECDRCSISQVHHQIIAAFETKSKTNKERGEI